MGITLSFMTQNMKRSSSVLSGMQRSAMQGFLKKTIIMRPSMVLNVTVLESLSPTPTRIPAVILIRKEGCTGGLGQETLKMMC